MKNKLLTTAIIICFALGLLFISINPIQHYLIARTSKQLADATMTVTATPLPDKAPSIEIVAPAADIPQQVEASYDFEEVQSLSIWDVLEAQSQAKNMPAIGSIYIPSVDMKLPILQGVGKYALAVGAGTMKRNQQMGHGNYALASHYIEGQDILFGPLYELKVGDSIFLTDKDMIYEYKAITKKVIQATDVHVIEDVANETLLTLITCAEQGTKRLSVVAQFVEATPADSK